MSIFSGLFNRTYPLDLEGFVDRHCHILPGVDDGVRTMEESLLILDHYEKTGIKEAWLTPHIMEDIPNTTDSLRRRFKELTDAYAGNVKLHLASENMIDNLFFERLEANDLLPIGEDGKTLLVETSYFSAPMKYYETLKAIRSKGYHPLLAHPERYNYIDTIATYRELKELGVKFQLNLMSLGGHYGAVVRDKARRLLDAGMYDCIGSDLHRAEHLDIVKGMRLKKSTLDKLP